jgi:hypothetical protein
MAITPTTQLNGRSDWTLMTAVHDQPDLGEGPSASVLSCWSAGPVCYPRQPAMAAGGAVAAKGAGNRSDPFPQADRPMGQR